MTDEPYAERPLRPRNHWVERACMMAAGACSLVGGGCVVSESRSSFEDCAACEAPRPYEPLTCSATDAAGFGALASEPVYFGLRTTLAGDMPHVLGVARDGERVSAKVDGSSAMAELGESLRVRTADAAGRNLDFELCPRSELGRVARCGGARCEYGDIVVLPLGEWTPDALDAGFTSESMDSGVDAGATSPAPFELLAEFADPAWPTGPTLDLDVSPGLAILARGADGLRVVEISDGERPALTPARHVAAERGDFYNDVRLLDGGWAAAASLSHGLVMVELGSGQSEPVLALGERANGHNLCLDGDTIYVARSGKSGGVSLVDVSEPSAARVLGEITLPGCANVHDLRIAGDRAYVNCFDVGLFVVDTSRRDDWLVVDRVEQFRSHSIWVVERGDRDLVVFSAEDFASTLWVAWYDPSAGFDLLAELRTGDASSVHNLHCVDRRCFATAYQSGWLQFDVSRPQAPRVRAGAPTWDGPGNDFYEGASGISVFAERVFVADTQRGLLVYGRAPAR